MVCPNPKYLSPETAHRDFFLDQKNTLWRFFSHDTVDPDGNLLQDGRFKYQWNAENHLLKVESIIETDENGDPVYYDGDIVAEFTYDYMGRRVSKKVSRYFVIPGTEGGGGWIEKKTREIEEKLAANIAKINERLARQVTHFEGNYLAFLKFF